MSMGKLLIVEDDAKTNELLARSLTRNNYTVTCAYSGLEGRYLLKQERFDCILMDLVLPGLDGESLIAEMRKKQTVPIIVISGKPGIEARVNALRLGADDFIPKPFSCEEVVARVAAQLRRNCIYSPADQSAPVLIWKNCILNTETAEIIVNSQKLSFTALELQIMEKLMRNPYKVFTRADLFESCWKKEFLEDYNTVSVYISRIRKKIAEADPQTKYIKTLYGIGFRLNA